jgi:hypothetical protein
MELTTDEVDQQGARAFWTYWSAGATSSVGSAVGAVALPLAALLALDATAFEMGVISASAYRRRPGQGLSDGSTMAASA